jgi:ribosomal protein S18 acetylase RimI-like enzyme
MAFGWHSEGSPPRWDEDKIRVVGAAPAGLFGSLRALAPGAMLPGDWWRVTDEEQVVGYAWMDVTWGDAEILLAVDPAAQRRGIGTYALDRLDEEAGRRGLRYLYNVVPAAHPAPDALTGWLERRGFASTGKFPESSPSGPDFGVLRRRVTGG